MAKMDSISHREAPNKDIDEGHALLKSLETEKPTTIDMHGQLLHYYQVSNIALYIWQNKDGEHAVTTLNLAGCEICDECMDVLARAMEGNRTLREVNLSGNNITSTGADKLLPAVQKCGAIIDLNDNLITSRTVKWMCEELGPCAYRLASTGYMIYKAETEEGEVFLNALQERRPKWIDLSRKPLHYYEIKALAEYIAEHPVTSLNLECCGIDDIGARQLAWAMNGNKTLTEVNLSRNAITSEGARLLLPVLKKCEKIESINVSVNQIDSETLRNGLGLTTEDSWKLEHGHPKFFIEGNGPLQEQRSLDAAIRAYQREQAALKQDRPIKKAEVHWPVLQQCKRIGHEALMSMQWMLGNAASYVGYALETPRLFLSGNIAPPEQGDLPTATQTHPEEQTVAAQDPRIRANEGEKSHASRVFDLPGQGRSR